MDYMKPEIKPLSKEQTTATMAVKCYIEQLSSEEELIAAVRVIPPEECHVIALKHYKSKKPHWHVLVRGANRDKKFRVSSMLKRLTIQFRDGIDDALWKNRGVETTGYYSNYAVYLLHQTIDAQREGKAPYDAADFVSNLSADEIQQVLDGYSITKKTLKPAQLPIVIENARKAGYNLQNVDEFISSLQILGLTSAKESEIRKAYLNGVQERMREHKRMYRLFINIYYDGNKIYADSDEYYKQMKFFYAAEKALEGKRISSTKGHARLRLDPSIEAIVLDKRGWDECLFDDYICEVGKPHATEKSIWAGSTLVQIEKKQHSSIKDLKSSIHDNRFFCCIVQDNQLKCFAAPVLPATFTNEEMIRLKEEFEKFRDRFNDALAEYDTMQEERNVSFDDIIDLA